MDTGGMDVNRWVDQYEQDARAAQGWEEREQNHIWLDFEPVKTKGDESHLIVRVIHDVVRPDQSGACVPTSRHRVPVEFVPGDHGQRKVRQYNCYDQPDGPGECPLCLVYGDISKLDNPGTAILLDKLKPDVSNAWQVINLMDPSKHWVQELDDRGSAVIDPMTGQAKWKAVPGVVRVRKKLNQRMVTLLQNKGPFWDPSGRNQIGYPLRLIKKKTGDDKFNVEYDAMDLAPCPIDPQLYPIITNAIDLRKEMRQFVDRSLLEKIAAAIRVKFGIPAAGQQPPAGAHAPHGMAPPMSPPIPNAGQWTLHPQYPGYEYNTATGAYRAAQQAQPMAPPPFSAPPAPQAPPSGQYGAQYGAPSAMPPVAIPQTSMPWAQPPAPQPPPMPYPQAPQGPPPPFAAPPMGPPPAPFAPPAGPPPPFTTTQFPTTGAPPMGPPPSPFGAPPPHLPPPGAPGLAPGGPPMFAPPPGPGMPPGLHPQAPPPLMPPPGPIPTGGGLTPEQLEAQLGGPPPPPPSKIPF
jgi:hypothetical protein